MVKTNKNTQADFRLQIATDMEFTHITRDSDEISSTESTYTESNALQNGFYFARVKVKDNKDMWSGWSQFIMFSISGPQILSYTYDANGNLTQKTKGIEWWKYYYDYENRLTKVEYFDGSQTTVLGEYFYDGDGKRIKKVESLQTTIYIYLGRNIIFEKESSTMKKITSFGILRLIYLYLGKICVNCN